MNIRDLGISGIRLFGVLWTLEVFQIGRLLAVVMEVSPSQEYVLIMLTILLPTAKKPKK
jgi:hypothetical protein